MTGLLLETGYALAGQSSLEELAYRRKGLWFALGIIVLVLVALALKIHTL